MTTNEPLGVDDLIDQDALDFARDTLGPNATEDEVRTLAEERAARDHKELDYQAGRTTGISDHANGVSLDDTDQVKAWAVASEEWKRGWSDGWEARASTV